MKRILMLVLLVAACSKPADGLQGPQGIKGDPGDSIVGPPGQDGASGHDASPASIVQLCPNDVAHYPDVFVEVAICLQGKLYGVYSANGGFLTELPPGDYTSSAIGSACNLTVLDNCAIQ